MADIIRLRNNPHEEVQELLPWLVNGTLEPCEVASIEAHLEGCAQCRAELAAEWQLAAAIERSSIEPEAAWDRMEQRLSVAGTRKTASKSPIWQRHVPLGWALASPLALAAAFALLIVNLPARPALEPQYRALGSAETAQPANLVVQFEPATRVSEMQQALQSVDARLVDGPTETGAYLLRVDRARRELALKRLRDDQAIALAQPIDGPSRE